MMQPDIHRQADISVHTLTTENVFLRVFMLAPYIRFASTKMRRIRTIRPRPPLG